MYHISDLRQFNNCPKLYYFNQNSNDVFNQYLRNDYSLTILLAQYFGVDSYFEGQKNQNTEVFINNKEKYEWFFNVRFNDGEMRIKVPVLHKTDGSYDLYFIQYKTSISDIDFYNIRVTYSLLKNIGISVHKIFIISFNGDYVRGNELDVKKLFVLNKRINYRDIFNIVKEKEIDYKSIINQIESTDLENCEYRKTKQCKNVGICKYYDICFKEELDLPDDNILTLVSSQYKNDMYKDGIIHLKDVDITRIEGNRIQYAQIMASKNNGLFMDKIALNKWLESCKEYPISFIDFEWETYLIPSYKGLKPFDTLCFEFALYYLDENGKLNHKVYVGIGDCREEFIKTLIEYLPDKGPIFAYNALGAEMVRLEELCVQFPQYEEKLKAIIDRFVDLSIPFLEGMIYDTSMRGNFSVKGLLSIVSKYSYKDMNISDGLEAVHFHRLINSSCDNEKVIESLKEYCSLDAYSLFLVFKWLVEKAVS